MNQPPIPSPPPGASVSIASAPPSYDEAMGNVVSVSRDQDISNPTQVVDGLQEENDPRKKDQKKEAQPLATAPPLLVTTQPLPEATYSFQPPVTHQPQPANDCCLCCYWLNGEDIIDICYCMFCCSRRLTDRDAGCCDCGDGCCCCPDSCCEGNDCDCDCGDCNCDCGDCDCDCGDCNCDCGDCTIL